MDYDLTDINLEGSVCRGCSFRGSMLAWTNLRSADFTDAILSESDFRGALLMHADLTGAVLDPDASSGVSSTTVSQYFLAKGEGSRPTSMLVPRVESRAEWLHSVDQLGLKRRATLHKG
ncbi:pentapeptide repeat-containing protein [Corynebacterium diphtheriae]|uniref:pentapeptide repeat-containing protein n=1 Tax=Corynebacterium diphtheriae TaxID=1717 RepID=UPI003531FA40